MQPKGKEVTGIVLESMIGDFIDEHMWICSLHNVGRGQREVLTCEGQQESLISHVVNLSLSEHSTSFKKSMNRCSALNAAVATNLENKQLLTSIAALTPADYAVL